MGGNNCGMDVTNLIYKFKGFIGNPSTVERLAAVRAEFPINSDALANLNKANMESLKFLATILNVPNKHFYIFGEKNMDNLINDIKTKITNETITAPFEASLAIRKQQHSAVNPTQSVTTIAGKPIISGEDLRKLKYISQGELAEWAGSNFCASEVLKSLRLKGILNEYDQIQGNNLSAEKMTEWPGLYSFLLYK